MEITGKVLEIHEIRSGQGKKDTWYSQQIILETIGQYPKKVAIQYWGAMVDSLTEVGQEVTVSVNPESRSYNDKWYTELRVWKTNKLGQSQPPESRRSKEAGLDRHDDYSHNQPTSNPPASDLDDSNLPF